MQITRIIIKNFRGLPDVDLDGLSAATAVFGLNGAGKSSLFAAVRLTLFGWCQFTDRRGAGAAKLIADGARTAEIAVVADGLRIDVTIARRGDNEFAVIDTSTGEVLEIKTRAALWEHLGIDMRHAQIAAMPELYLGTSDLEGALAQFLSGGVSVDEVFAMCGVREAWARQFAGRLADVDQFAAVGKRAYEERTAVNRELKEAKTLWDQVSHLRAPRDSNGGQYSEADLKMLASSEAEFQRQLADVRTELGRAQASHPDNSAEIARIEQEIEAASKQAAKTDDEIIATGAAHQAAEAARDTCKQAVAKAHHESVLQDRAVADAKRALAALGDGGCCPTCQRKYTAKDRAALIAPLEALVIEAASKQAELIATHQNLIVELDGHHKAYTTARTAWEDAESRGRAARGRLATLRDQVTRLQTVPAVATRAASDVERDINHLEAGLQETREARVKLNEYVEAQRCKARVAYLEGQVEPLDWAVKAFKDGEILKAAVINEMDAFIARCSRELQPFGCALDIEVSGKKVAVLLQVPGHEFRPVDLCSNGEQMLASFALASAFADTGAPILLDNLNELDHAWRKGVLLALRQRAAASSVIVAGAWQQSKADIDQVAKSLDPVTVVWADRGSMTVRGVAAVEAA